MAAEVRLTWNANAPGELVSAYNVYQDNALVGSPTGTELVIPAVPAGAHAYQIAAVNVWGEGPKSDPVMTPDIASKVGGVQISITVNVSVGG